MNKIFSLLIVAASFASCQQSPSAASTDTAVTVETPVIAEDAAVISFESGMYNFGKIKQGDKVSHEYTFKNIGKSPLIISNATATCGCTTPDIPKAPIQPGESGVIKVVFDSAGKMGMQDKVITITSNANPTTTELHLIGKIN